jgi:hypothetical protein
MFNDDPRKKAKWFELFKDPIFYPVVDLPLDELRTLASKRL